MFGPHASLDLKGSFAVTTADYVRLADGRRVDATAPASNALSSAPPAAFGFLGSHAPAAISVRGQIAPGNQPVLSPALGKSLVVWEGMFSSPAVS